MANEKDIEVTLKVDTTIARARLDEVKKIINELKTILGDQAAFTKSFDALEIKVSTVQEKIENLRGVLEQLGETTNAVFVFQDLSTNITHVNQEVISLNQQTNTLIQSFEGVAAAGEKVSAEVVPVLAEKTNELAKNTQEAKEKVSGLTALFENDLPIIRDEMGKLSGAIEDIKGGFAAANDLAKVFGLENEYITQTINKLTKAQAAINEAQKVAKTIQEGYTKVTKALTAAKTAYNAVNTLVSKGLKILKIAMASTGIGLLIVGVSMLIANFDKVKETIGKVVSKFNPLKLIVDGVKKAFNFLAEVAMNMFNGFGLISKALGILAEKFPFLKKVIDPVKKVIDNLRNISGLLVWGFDKIREGVQKLADKFPALGKAIKAVKDFFNDLMEVGRNVLDWLGFTSEKTEETNAKVAKSNQKAAKDARQHAQEHKELLKEKVEAKKAADEAEAESEEEKNERLRKEQEDRLRMEQDTQRLRIANMQEGVEKSLAEEEFRYQQEQEKYKDNAEALEQLRIQHENNVLDIKAEWENKQKAQEEKQQKEREKNYRDHVKRLRDAEKLRIENMQDGLAKSLAAEELHYKEQRDKYKDNAAALEQLRIQHQNRIAQINKDWADKEAAKKEKSRQEEVANYKTKLSEELKNHSTDVQEKKKNFDEELKQKLDDNKKAEQADREAMIKGQLTAKEYDQRKKDREIATRLESEAETQDFYSQQIVGVQAYYNNLIEEERKKISEKGYTQEEFEKINTDLAKQRDEAEKTLKAEQDQAQKEAENIATEERLARLQEAVEREKAIKKAGWDFAENMGRKGLDITNTLNDAFTKNAKKQNDIQKATTLVKIGIDSARAISSAIANANSPTPDNVATGGLAGIAKFVTISAQIASAVAQAHKVLSTGVGSQGGGESPSAPTVSAPQLTAPQIGGTQIIPGANKPEPIKVFVTEADIRNTQQKVKVIEGQSEVV